MRQFVSFYCKRKFILLFVAFVIFSSCGIKRSAILPQISENTIYRNYPDLDSIQIDSLKQIYGKNKIFIPKYIKPSLIALSYYPELKDVPIEFKYSKEKTTMAARPIPISIFSKKRYMVLINKNADFDGILLENVPYNAQIGIVGHELAHIADYNKHNVWGILGILFRFADNKRKPLFEKETDRETIIRGLGWQLYDWATFSMYSNPYATEEYKEFKRRTYMKPDEIKKYINSLAKYASSTTHP